MNMTTKDILNQQVTVAHSATDKLSYANSSIGNVIFNLASKWKDHINHLRDVLNTEGGTAYKKLKPFTPCWFVHGTVKGGIGDENMDTFTNIIALDIDVKPGENDNIDIDKLRMEMFNQPYTVAALKSLSGKGIYILVYVEDHIHNKGYYEYFNSMIYRKYKATIDMNSTSLSRKRFISYEDGIENWVKPMDMEITPWTLYVRDEVNDLFKDKPVEQRHVRRNTQTTLFDNNFVTERTKEAIIKSITIGGLSVDYFNKKENNSALNVWWHIGNEIKYFFGDVEGEQLFYQFSTNTSQYNDDQKVIRKQFESCNADKAIDGKNTKTEDDLHSKWQGIAKNLLGIGWWKKQVTNQ